MVLSPQLIDVGIKPYLILFDSWLLSFIIFIAAVFVIFYHKTVILSINSL